MQYKYDAICSLLCQLWWSLCAYMVIHYITTRIQIHNSHVDQRGIQVPTRVLAGWRVKSCTVALGPGGNLLFQFSESVFRCQTVVWVVLTNKMITVEITLVLKEFFEKWSCLFKHESSRPLMLQQQQQQQYNIFVLMYSDLPTKKLKPKSYFCCGLFLLKPVWFPAGFLQVSVAFCQKVTCVDTQVEYK